MGHARLSAHAIANVGVDFLLGSIPSLTMLLILPGRPIARTRAFLSSTSEQRLASATSAISMCGRVVQSSGPIRLAIVDGLNVRDNRSENVRRRYNAAPSPGAAGDPAEPQDERAVPRPSQVGPNPALVTVFMDP